MNQREYERLKADALSEYKRKLDAIEMVWRMSGGANQTGASSNSFLESSVGKGFLSQAIRNALKLLPGEFNIRDVEKQILAIDQALASRIKRASLSSALKRLEEEKEIVLVEKGKGKRASRYRKAA